MISIFFFMDLPSTNPYDRSILEQLIAAVGFSLIR